MTWIRLRLTSIATVCASIYIIGGVFAPTIALACEGAGEEPQNVTNTPVEWSGGGGRCPTNRSGMSVFFNREGEWCEYQIENRNSSEEVEVVTLRLEFEAGSECAAAPFCVKGVGVRAGGTECRSNAPVTRLPRGTFCYIRLEYRPRIRTAGRRESTKFLVETRARPSGLFARPEVSQEVEG
jgi:hypothetical protein